MTNAGVEPYGELVARALRYAGPVRMGNGCSGDLVFELATAIETLVRRAEAAEEAEDAAKECFWAIYPDWVKANGHGLTQEAAKHALAARAEAAKLRDALIYIDAYISQAAEIGASPLWSTIQDRARRALRGEP